MVSQRVTSYAIAAACGVSQPTVSRILAGRSERYSPATRQRVLDAAQRLGYRPNAAARITRTGRFGTVALLLSTWRERSNVAADLVNGIADALSAQGQNLMLVKLPDELLTDAEALPRILREQASDGLLIDYTHAIPDALIALIDRLSVPAVWINSRQPANCVRPDDEGAGRRAVETLVALGHRRIAYADFGRPDHAGQHYSVADRLAGYEQAMAAAGLRPQIIGAPSGCEVRGSDRVDRARQALTMARAPTACVCHSSKSSLPLQMAAAGLGRAVPDDLSLITFEDHPIDYLGPAHTTLRVPQLEVGRQAVAMLLERIARPGLSRPETTVAFELVTGGTVARAGKLHPIRPT